MSHELKSGQSEISLKPQLWLMVVLGILGAFATMWWLMASSLAYITGLPEWATLVVVVGLLAKFTLNERSFDRLHPQFFKVMYLSMVGQCMWWTIFVQQSVWQTMFMVGFSLLVFNVKTVNKWLLPFLKTK